MEYDAETFILYGIFMIFVLIPRMMLKNVLLIYSDIEFSTEPLSLKSIFYLWRFATHAPVLSTHFI